MSRPRVAIVGAGAVGGVVAASLQTAGKCDLTLLARGACLKRLMSHGLEVQRHDGGHVHCKPRAIDVADASAAGKQDYVLLCTKAHQQPATASAVAAMLEPQPRAVP